MSGWDFIVVGAGMAGASAAYYLANHGRVVVVEMEAQPGYHSTGRSAALYTETYGNATIRALTTGSRAFFDEPPTGFSETALWSPRGALFIGRADQQVALECHFETVRPLCRNIHRMGAAEVCEMIPVLRPTYVAGGIFEPDAMDLDVAAIHQGFLGGLRARGGQIVLRAPAIAATRRNGAWHVETAQGVQSAPVLVNAAGAWADKVAQLVGVRPIGLTPKRRTVILFDAPPDTRTGDWPIVADVAEQFYFKPESGKILGSPADETPVPPSDTQAEEIDIAMAVDRIQQATSLVIRRVTSKWAGLRSFVADKTPVVGFDPKAPGFFWLAAQGGYGIQTAPAMASLAAALIRGSPVPAGLAELGVTEQLLSPARLARQVSAFA